MSRLAGRMRSNRKCALIAGGDHFGGWRLRVPDLCHHLSSRPAKLPPDEVAPVQCHNAFAAAVASPAAFVIPQESASAFASSCQPAIPRRSADKKRPAQLTLEKDALAVASPGDEGFLLIAVLIMVFLVLLTLSIAAPRVAMQMKREKEIETQHRANQYVRGIRMYYKKFQSYPPSIKALENSNNQKFLRQHYIDPMTGKDDWKLIELGKNKTKVKGFFGEDLPGIGGGLGDAASMTSPSGSSGSTFGTPAGAGGGSAFGSNTGGTGGSAFGGSTGGTGTGIGGGSAFGGTTGGSGSVFGGDSGTPGGSATGTPGTSSPSGTSPSTGNTGNPNGSTTGTTNAGSANQTPSPGQPGSSTDSASAFSGGLAPIIGVAIPKSGDAFLSVNEKTSYQDWEFLYDPRIEQLYAKGNLLGGGGALAGSSSGSGFGSGTGTGTGNGSAFGTSGTGTGGAFGSGGGQNGSSSIFDTPGSKSPSSSNPSNPTNPNNPNAPANPTPDPNNPNPNPSNPNNPNGNPPTTPPATPPQ